MKTIDLILEKVETNQRLLKELTSKVENLGKAKKTTKKKKTTNSLGNPKATTPKILIVPKKPEPSVDELIEMIESEPRTPRTPKTKKPKVVRELAKELDSDKKKEVSLSELVADLKKT